MNIRKAKDETRDSALKMGKKTSTTCIRETAFHSVALFIEKFQTSLQSNGGFSDKI